MNFLDALKNEDNYTHTENNAVALHSTMNACLDAFGSLGAMRFCEEENIIKIFSKAFAENRALAVKMLFYMRDIRGGQGARKVFRVIVKWLAEVAPKYVIENLDNFLEYGRGDDILCLIDTSIKTEVFYWICNRLHQDLVNYDSGRPCSLLAKWLPSENTSSKETRKKARMIIEGLNLTPRQYRKILSLLRAHLNVVETKMSAREWESIDYKNVPARAMINYTDAFAKHDEKRYLSYLKDVAVGELKINAASLFPVDIIHRVWNAHRASNKNRILLNSMWEALPNYCEGHEETGICVVDTSGSMYGTPIEVAISLGMYCADKCRGPFAKHFITFSKNPRLQEISGADIIEKTLNLANSDWNMNTNLEKVFDLILDTGIKNRVADKDMPKKLYIISDMQFDIARGTDKSGSFMQKMRKKYEAAGYTMPIIVYWNVRQSDCGMFQDTFQGEQCCMVSGYSPSLFKAIIEGTTYEEVVSVDDNGNKTKTLKETVDPITVMLNTLNSERYDQVWVG